RHCVERNIASLPRSGVGNECIHTFKPLEDLIKHASDFGLTCEVCLDGNALRLRQFALQRRNCRLALPIMQDKRCSFGSELASYGGTDSSGCACDQNDFLIRIRFHVSEMVPVLKEDFQGVNIRDSVLCIANTSRTIVCRVLYESNHCGICQSLWID